MTIIDIRYYPKSSLNEDFRLTVINNSPMLHCKVAIPPWLAEEKSKFNVNWKHYPLFNKWKSILALWRLRFDKAAYRNKSN